MGLPRFAICATCWPIPPTIAPTMTFRSGNGPTLRKRGAAAPRGRTMLRRLDGGPSLLRFVVPQGPPEDALSSSDTKPIKYNSSVGFHRLLLCASANSYKTFLKSYHFFRYSKKYIFIFVFITCALITQELPNGFGWGLRW
jgi:hypothetical protein